MRLPEQLLHDLQIVNGFDEKAFIAAHEQEAVTSVRMHPIKRSSGFAGNTEVPWCPTGRYLDKRPVFTLDPLYHAGAYYVQEASSMFLHYVLDQVLPSKKNLKVLDLCAAPGGKSTLIASLLDESSLLISNEVIRTRASILEENMTRWGYMNTWVTSNDPTVFGKLRGYFDVVVVDAPCSGSGLFRKDQHALNEWSEANVQLCSERQKRILADVWPSIKEDGILVYATCSYSPQEDEAILKWLEEQFDGEKIEIRVPVEWNIVEVGAQIKGYRFFPDKVNGEGFFIAAIRKKESAAILKYPKFRPCKKDILKQAGHLLNREDVSCVETGESNYAAILQHHEQELNLLREILYMRKVGIELGMPTAKEWVPAHDVALSIDVAKNIASAEMDKEQALKFLKKEEIDATVFTKGWNLVKYEGLSLGWVKHIDNRVNNYLPKHWRIRMDITDADWK